MPSQFTAVTGRKTNRNYLDMIRAEAAFAPENKYRKDTMALDKEAMEFSKMDADRNYALGVSSNKIAKEQARYANMINLAGLGLQAAELGNSRGWTIGGLLGGSGGGGKEGDPANLDALSIQNWG